MTKRNEYLVTFHVPGYHVTTKVQATNAEQAKVKAFILSGKHVLSVEFIRKIYGKP